MLPAIYHPEKSGGTLHVPAAAAGSTRHVAEGRLERSGRLERRGELSEGAS